LQEEEIFETSRITIRVPREEIVFVDMLFKAYEGLALATIDRERTGLIHLDVTPGTRADVLAILKDLQEKMPLFIVEDDSI
jgi:hypothetical protein